MRDKYAKSEEPIACSIWRALINDYYELGKSDGKIWMLDEEKENKEQIKTNQALIVELFRNAFNDLKELRAIFKNSWIYRSLNINCLGKYWKDIEKIFKRERMASIRDSEEINSVKTNNSRIISKEISPVKKIKKLDELRVISGVGFSFSPQIYKKKIMKKKNKLTSTNENNMKEIKIYEFKDFVNECYNKEPPKKNNSDFSLLLVNNIFNEMAKILNFCLEIIKVKNEEIKRLNDNSTSEIAVIEYKDDKFKVKKKI